MAPPGPRRRHETPAGFGPPTGFAMPGGPRLHDRSGAPRTSGPVGLAAVGTILCFPLGAPALVLAVMAHAAVQRGEIDGARRRLRRARPLAWAAIVAGVLAWTAAVVSWVA